MSALVADTQDVTLVLAVVLLGAIWIGAFVKYYRSRAQGQPLFSRKITQEPYASQPAKQGSGSVVEAFGQHWRDALPWWLFLGMFAVVGPIVITQRLQKEFPMVMMTATGVLLACMFIHVQVAVRRVSVVLNDRSFSYPVKLLLVQGPTLALAGAGAIIGFSVKWMLE